MRRERGSAMQMMHSESSSSNAGVGAATTAGVVAAVVDVASWEGADKTRGLALLQSRSIKLMNAH